MLLLLLICFEDVEEMYSMNIAKSKPVLTMVFYLVTSTLGTFVLCAGAVNLQTKNKFN